MNENKKNISATEKKDKGGTKFIVTNTFTGTKSLTELLTKLAVKEAKDQKTN